MAIDKCHAFIEGDPRKVQFVGYGGEYSVGNGEMRTHTGPCARIFYDKTWITIETDEYEGSAMLNIETLPFLRRALANVARAIREDSEKARGKKADKRIS